MKKIWLFCLCLASLSLAGCFHVPDENWLPSKNKVNPWDAQKDEEMNYVIDGFMNWINIISTEWNQLNNDENNDIIIEKSEKMDVDIENGVISDIEMIENEESIDDKIEDKQIEENIIYEE